MKQILVGIFVALMASSANAEALEDAIIPSASGIQVYDSGPIDGSAPHLIVAPLFSSTIQALGVGHIFDLRALANSSGVELDPEELVLYSPQSRLIFCRASHERIDMIRRLFESHDHDLMAYRFTLFAGRAEPAEKDGAVTVAARRIVMRGSSVSGARFEVSLNESQHFY